MVAVRNEFGSNALGRGRTFCKTGHVLEIGVQNGPTSGVRWASEMDPPQRFLEALSQFGFQFRSRRMLTVDDFGRIRRAHRDGMSIREIARRFHHSRYRVREILRGEQSEPRPYSRRKTQTAPKLGAFHERILEILRDDEDQPPKQRHSAMRTQGVFVA